MVVLHKRLSDKKGADFYPTPRWGTLALLEHVGFTGPILEPCCGDGAMSRVLEEHRYEVISSDKYDRGYGKVRDFFDIEKRCSNLVTNPPYNKAEQILEHAFKIVDRKICLLLRMSFSESKRRYFKLYRHNPPIKILVFSERLSLYHPDAPYTSGGGTVAYGWFIWDRRITGRPTTTVEWIRPGLKTAPKRA